MVNEMLSQISPSEGFSVVRQAMEDAIAFFLPIGGPALARQHVESLASSMSFYPDCRDAYRDAMAKISQIEKAEQQRQEEHRLQQQQELIIQLIGAAKPHKGSDPSCEFGVLPAKLSTGKAMLMWQRLQQAGLIDDHYQPVNLLYHGDVPPDIRVLSIHKTSFTSNSILFPRNSFGSSEDFCIFAVDKQ